MSDDDYPGDLTTGAVVALGESVAGGLEKAADRDWFKVFLRAGSSYYFTLDGDNAGLPALRDPVLYFYDGAGQSLSENDDSGGGLGSRVVYTAAYTGYYYLAAGAYGDWQTGGYRLAAGSYDDDLTSLNPATLAAGGSLRGALEVAGDNDWVRLELASGVTYTIRLQGVDSGQGTLADPMLFIYDGQGEVLDRDDDGSGRRDSALTFSPTASGAYYLALGAYDNLSTGSYRLSLDQQADDFSAGADTPDGLSVGGSATGELEKAGDADGFSLELLAGRTYYFDLMGRDSGQGTLADPYLWLRDASGNRLAFNDDGGQGLDSRIVFTPSASGVYHLQAEGFDGRQVGSYLLGAGELPDSQAAGPGRVTAYGQVQGQLAGPGERDWVSLTLEAATTYLFMLEGSGGGALPDASLVLRESQGGQVVYGRTAEDLPGDGSGAATLSFMPEQGGSYYVDIGAAGENDAGRYLLTVVGRQVEEFASGTVYGDWSATDLFSNQSTFATGALAGDGMAGADQAVTASQTFGAKDQNTGLLALGS